MGCPSNKYMFKICIYFYYHRGFNGIKLILIINIILEVKTTNKMNPPTLSLCIPRIESIITKDYIIKTFHKLNLGNIEKIKELPLRNDNKYKRIIMSLTPNNSENSLFMKTRIENNENIKIVHDMPWYWKVQAARP